MRVLSFLDGPLIDGEEIARGATLLHAQCWLWGQDIRSPHGDLLSASGLERATFEEANSHRSHYRAELANAAFVVAWGGGFVYGDEAGSLFLPRLRFVPRRLDEIRSLDDLPDLNVVHDQTGVGPTVDTVLLVAALDWLAAYEEGISLLAGPEWRAACARLWSEIEAGAREAAASVGVTYEPLPPLPADGLAAAWRALRSSIERRGPENSAP